MVQQGARPMVGSNLLTLDGDHERCAMIEPEKEQYRVWNVIFFPETRQCLLQS